tara:strand:- start:547 stop:1041 length:495 start_codon:yes stop_codon:yes gene_type:complete
MTNASKSRTWYFRHKTETIEEYIERIEGLIEREHNTEVLVQIARDVFKTIHDAYPHFIGIKGSYTGGGDSGYADNHKPIFKGGKAFDETSSACQTYLKKFDDIIDTFCWSIPYSVNPGMEINGGCDGELIIELKDEPNDDGELWHVSIEHTAYIEDSNYNEYEL